MHQALAARRRVLTLSGAALLAANAPFGAAHAQSTAAQDTTWKKLEAASWIRDGQASAPQIVYVITDPNCIWCHRFWEAARPWVAAGKVQVRHLLVGIIRPDSPRKAATILNSKDPAAAIEQNEKAFGNGGIFPSGAVNESAKRKLDGNLQLMRELDFRGTPAIIFKNRAGVVEKIAGFPRSERMEAVMGER
ncbi:thiol:disulfide interchange protein DsbG [Pseudorhodoferax soli]|uniref:Thiol:disulfide interchange protein n=1 Tax=Pseudorhodoferax soli TaxID=545864 RepID=A0A368XL17_9BURK|nr:thiol:disulfide interchange protein DsbG [Pseudorhodoferax soli]RCW68672.1 thioredoxin-like protein [Pseudorhodoferax soli]